MEEQISFVTKIQNLFLSVKKKKRKGQKNSELCMYASYNTPLTKVLLRKKDHKQNMQVFKRIALDIINNFCL